MIASINPSLYLIYTWKHHQREKTQYIQVLVLLQVPGTHGEPWTVLPQINKRGLLHVYRSPQRRKGLLNTTQKPEAMELKTDNLKSHRNSARSKSSTNKVKRQQSLAPCLLFICKELLGFNVFKDWQNRKKWAHRRSTEFKEGESNAIPNICKKGLGVWLSGKCWSNIHKALGSIPSKERLQTGF